MSLNGGWGRRLAGLVFVASFVTACGASIQAVYEGDVRFEHCMGLDSRADVKPTLRRACWQEWLKFYTFGQTRDRVDYAYNRDRQLSQASDFDEADIAARTHTGAVPDPTSAMAPPPMMLHGAGSSDAGAPRDGGPAALDAGAAPPDENPTPASDCTAECEDSWKFCKQDCKTPACEKACAAKYKRCMRRCF